MSEEGDTRKCIDIIINKTYHNIDRTKDFTIVDFVYSIVNGRCKVLVEGETDPRYYELGRGDFLISEVNKRGNSICYLGIEHPERANCIFEDIKNIWNDLHKENKVLRFE